MGRFVSWAREPGLAVLIVLSSLGFGVAASRAASPLSSPPPATPETGAFARYEELRWKGLDVTLPGPRDTVDGEAGGLRAKLADLGIGYLGVALQNFATNTLDVARTTNGHQLYSGQRPTFSTQDFLVVTFDTGRIGLPGGQIVVGGARSYYTWLQGGPAKFGLQTLTYDQPLFGGRVEVKAGYLVNSFEFANSYIGGALATGVFGQNGNILVQGGLNAGVVTTPGFEAKFNLSKMVYTTVGVERPISPDGTVTEALQNPTSFRLRVPNTGILVIDETGYKVAAAPGQHEVWVRAAVAGNSSRYNDYTAATGQRTAGMNGFAYLLADTQILQVDPNDHPSRGLYAGLSFNYAPPDYNRFSQFYQGRLYAKGFFDARPTDLISFVAAYNVFSGTLYDTAIKAGSLAHIGSTALTASYAAHLLPGFYLNIGMTYVDHPTSITYTSKTGSALNVLTNLSFFF